LPKKTDLFVPGRLCLFGEHSDWAGEYRETDPSVETGRCIIAGTDQGIYGISEPAASGFGISQILQDGSAGQKQSYPTDAISLKRVAESAVFDSYAAGTASVILRKYPGLGLNILIYRRTLPLKKGLSSSAAVCVLVARAFSRSHSLGFSVSEEMEYAYQGELLTGSHCGRMDQACAYGIDPVLLTFNGSSMTTALLIPGETLHILIADLQGKKRTRKILDDLNASFKNGNKDIRRALGEENHRITAEACNAIANGDARILGELMIEAQNIFDDLVAPSCPSELDSPRLHELLDNTDVRNLTWGGEGRRLSGGRHSSVHLQGKRGEG